MLIEQRKLAKEGAAQYRVYRSSSIEELVKLQDKYKAHYVRSVEIIKECNFFTDQDLVDMEKLADDWAYKDLKIKVGDLGMVTKEIIHLKMDDDIRYEKKLHKITPSTHNWTKEQLSHLWRGKADVVAKIVNKTPDAVERKRKEYLNEHPEFIYPEECKMPRKNAKAVVVKNKEWTESEMKILFTMSGKALGAILHRTIFEISDRRRKYCIDNPDFVIPACADFKKGDLPNQVEDRRKNRTTKETQKVEEQKVVLHTDEEVKSEKNERFWTDEEKDLLWKHDINFLTTKFKHRTAGAFYTARIKYLQENPDFLIPQSAGWVPRKFRNRMAPVAAIAKKDIPIEEKQDMDDTRKLISIISQLPEGQKPKKVQIGNIILEF